MSGFYRVDDQEFYALGPVNLSLRTAADLESMIFEHSVVWHEEMWRRIIQIHNKSKIRQRITIVWFAVITAGAALAATEGTAAAGAAVAPGEAAVGGSVAGAEAGAAASTSAATTTTASSSTWFTTVQKAAGYVSTAAGVYGQATGDTDAQTLANAADVVASPDLTSTLANGAAALAYEDGLEIDMENAETRAAMEELARREQDRYAQQLRELSALSEKNPGGVAVEPEQAKIHLKDRDIIDWLLIGIPVLSLLFRG